MRIATFNVNGVNGRLSVLIRWLGETKPDVVCLQELKAADEKFPEPAIREAGYRAVWHGQKGWNGVAILSRSRAPMETRRGLPGDPDDAHSRYIEAAVNGVLIANATISGSLFGAAKGGNVTAQIFWLKTRARWREGSAADDPVPSADAASNSEVILTLPDNNRDPELTQVLRDAQQKYFAGKRQRQQPAASDA
jgi:exodeoxyribonuclease-3